VPKVESLSLDLHYFVVLERLQLEVLVFRLLENLRDAEHRF
jgi:hypothetical protein